MNLMHHPHVHCVVPAGGLSIDGAAWVLGREDFFLPVRVLSRVFRGKFMAYLKQAIGRGKLDYHGSLAPLADPDAMEQLLDQAVRHDWVVYAKTPLRRPRGGVEVPRPLHPPCGDLESATAGIGERSGHLLLEGLCAWQPLKRDDLGSNGVHPPLPVARPAVKLREDPLLQAGWPTAAGKRIWSVAGTCSAAPPQPSKTIHRD